MIEIITIVLLTASVIYVTARYVGDQNGE